MQLSALINAFACGRNWHSSVMHKKTFSFIVFAHNLTIAQAMTNQLLCMFAIESGRGICVLFFESIFVIQLVVSYDCGSCACDFVHYSVYLPIVH